MRQVEKERESSKCVRLVVTLVAMIQRGLLQKNIQQLHAHTFEDRLHGTN